MSVHSIDQINLEEFRGLSMNGGSHLVVTLHPLLPKCLHSLVSWAHHHAEDCRSCPDLKEVLERQCWGSVSAVWGCVDGHSYGMGTQTTKPRANPEHIERDPLLEGEQ